MSRPEGRQKPSLLDMTIGEIFGQIRLKMWNAAGAVVKLLAENDGTLRNQQILYDGAAQIRSKAEATGDQRISNLGWDGSALARIAVETTGEQKITLHGKDESDNIDPLRTDPGGVLWTRSYEDSVIAPPVALPAADGVLWSPPAPQTSVELYEIDFIVVNNAGVATGPVSLGIDIGAGGSLAIPEFWMDQEILPWPGNSGWSGTWLLRGADRIRGWNAAGANLATVHFRIRRIDTNI